ncbi:gas41 homologue, putative [Plasmodium malariae]|uniref:Gas41 homologue, putative n=1 Tax=Plasmodium malariae TaxID=5858 RepID=A0A1A8VP56_PLAMA|nr:gas41 homologue, putative [Plasmodium malariae]
MQRLSILGKSDAKCEVGKACSCWDLCLFTIAAVYTQPPYEVNEIGWGEFYLTVKIYFADSTQPPVNIVHFVKLNTEAEVTSPPCVVNETYEEIIFRNPTVSLYNKIVQIIKYNFKEDLYTKKYLQFQSTVQEEICDLMSEAAQLSKDINEVQQKYFSMKADMGVSSDEN